MLKESASYISPQQVQGWRDFLSQEDYMVYARRWGPGRVVMVIGEESQASRKAENNGLRDLLDIPSRLWGEGYSHRRTKRLRVGKKKRRLALSLSP